MDKYPAGIAKTYDLVITEWWKSASVAKVKRINPAIKVIFYRDLAGIITSYDDFGEASKHPDWFVRDAATNKRLVKEPFGWYLMDITNAGFRRHLIRYLGQKLAAYPMFDGIFLDDVYAKINPESFVVEGAKTPGTVNPAYVQSYSAAVSSFLKDVKAALPGKTIIINCDDAREYIEHVDGVMLEGFIHGSWQAATYYKDTVGWLADMHAFANAVLSDKIVLVHSGSQGNGDALHNQFLFCFASFLLLSNQNTYFFFDIPSTGTQLLPYPEYTRDIGPSLESVPSSMFATTVVKRSLSSSLSGWRTGGVPPVLIYANGGSALQFVSNSQNGSYLERCINLSGAPVGSLNISCSAKASGVVAGSDSWMNFALLGKFYDANNNLLLSGADLHFDPGTYGWRAYSISFQLPPSTDRYCVAALGLFPSASGTGWVQNLQIPMSTGMTGWAATSGVSIVQDNGMPALQFASKGPNGAYLSRCIRSCRLE